MRPNTQPQVNGFRAPHVPGEPPPKRSRHVDAFAEAIADGVPATTCTRLRDNALCEAGATTQCRDDKGPNVARDAYRFMYRLGSRWKIPLEIFRFQCPDDGAILEIPYLHPAKVAEYLLQHHPVLLFGESDFDKGLKAVASFWGCYKQSHPTHEVFSKFSDQDLHRVIPVSIHGDEGRGKRRSNTSVCSFEAVIGWKGNTSICSICSQKCLDTTLARRNTSLRRGKKLKSNMKGHSYLQHWLLFVLPATLWKHFKHLTGKVLECIAQHFHDAFHTGIRYRGQQWHLAVVGSKGDLKWFSAICHLVRGYEMKSPKADVECCHMCLAGRPGLPAEDLAGNPAWLTTMWSQRPWRQDNPPVLMSVPYDLTKPESLYKLDVFHTFRLGVFRDFCASSIFVLIRWGLYGAQGKVDDKLDRVYHHFKLWMSTTGKKASLRSFTSRLFSYKSTKSFPWMNIKGSDCTLVLKFIPTAVTGFLNGENLTPEQRRILSIIAHSARVAVRFFDVMYGHGIFLNPNCAQHLYELGTAFTNGFGLLAEYAMQNSQNLFGIKPKLHFGRHILLELKLQIDAQCDAIVSPVIYDCQQNEDLLGKICKLSRQIHSRVLMMRTLQFYLVKSAILCKRHLKSGSEGRACARGGTPFASAGVCIN